ncbi:Serine/threonine-protein kinase PknB [Caulifigura coniformis]|uniref:Serine/threonine-protein kinase PknB n=1 Tax=Caulifigura coniformis TaxID=2527983 RepID=A0A517SF19_9PLAN|nr:serine/threonine-protein kinase [Caulifigura coniformis]QDT54722.1 Serine/threonine-protein kinase PknB [Caulifigura coniformis]
MLPSTPEALIDQLVRQRILNARELPADLISSVASGTVDAALATLERRELLTAMQIERIRKGDTDGLVLGDYKLLYRNASGSFARVYRAASIIDGTMIGLKLLRERWSGDRDIVNLFHREGEIGQRLQHPNIVPVYECSSQGKFHYITMEFVEGGNLKNFLKIRGKLSPLETCRFILDMARGLEYALSKGYTHRDLKLTNALMSATGVAKLIDFGLAAEDSVFSRVGGDEMQTALEYSTLERHTNAPKNDCRSDLYFLGGIMFELLTGEPPYPPTKDREERKRFGRYRDVRPVTSIDPRLPYKVAGVVDRLMQTNPDNRFQTPGELVFEMEAIVRELGGTVTPVVAEAAKPAPADAAATTTKTAQPTILCIENRPKHQDVLRDYFSRHGFKLILVGDIDRAIQRVNATPPDCAVLMGDILGDRLESENARLRDMNRMRDTQFFIVLSEGQAKLKSQLAAELPGVNLLVQPITLRDLRKHLTATLEGRAAV